MSQNPILLIDDTDPSVQYSGKWFTRAGVATSSTGDGPAYLDSQHGTYSDASMSYTFNGTQIAVIGAAYNLSEPTVFPSWVCFVDGVGIGEGSSFDTMQARQQLCYSPSLDPDIPHTINVTVKGTANQAFLFDYFQYTASPKVPLDDVVVQVFSNDSSLTYGKEWQPVLQNSTFDSSGVFTSDTNASVFIPFTGTSLSWWGSTVNNSSFGSFPATGTYSLDGLQPITFEIPSLPSISSPSQRNEKYFDTGPLNYASHDLVVTYQGDDQTLPIFLNYLLIRTGSISLTGQPSLDSGLNQTLPPPKNMTGYIVGGVLGGLGFIALLVIAIVIYFKRRRMTKQREAARKSYGFQQPGISTQSSMTTLSISPRSWATLTLTDVITEGALSTNRSYSTRLSTNRSYSTRPSTNRSYSTRPGTNRSHSTRRTATDSTKSASQATMPTTMYTAGRSIAASEDGTKSGGVR